MAMTFDATLKDLGRDHAVDFLTAFDQPPVAVWSLLNVDLSTVTSAADFVIGLGEPLSEILHFDFQASASATKHADILVYNGLLYRQHLVPVHSIIILLRPKAAHTNLNGTVNYAARTSRGKMDFGYEVIRLWEIPASDLAQGGLGLLPLAVLGQLPANLSLEDGLAAVIQKVVQRLVDEAPTEQAKRLLTSVFLLTGLRVTRDTAKQIFQGVRMMHESDTYLAILDEGRAEGRAEGREEGREEQARKLILLQGKKRFGRVTKSTQKKLDSITDIQNLEKLAEKLLDVHGWKELFE